MPRNFYNRNAYRYDERHRNDTVKHMERFERAFLKKHVKGIVLDIGCGTGRTLAWIKNAVGCDISPEMLKQAKNKVPSPLLVSEAENLPFGDKIFDSVACMFTTLNLCDYEKAVQEMSRVLKPGGSAVVSVTSCWEKKN